MTKLIRIRRGARLLAKTLRQFDRIVTDLETAANDIANQRAKKAVKLGQRQSELIAFEQQHAMEDALLRAAHERANQVRGKIAALVQ